MSMTIEGAAAPASAQQVDAPQLQVFVMGLFFIFGGITSLNDVIIPKLKELFTLSYFEASLAVEPTQQTHLELARLADQLERPEEANKHYRASALLDAR